MSLEQHIRNIDQEQHRDIPVEDMWDHIAERQKQNTPKSYSLKWLGVAASLLAIVSISWLGYKNGKQQAQIDQLTTRLDSMFDNADMMQRLKMVHMPDPSWQENAAYINVLIDRLQNDENIPVRIASVEALVPYLQRENVLDAVLSVLSEGKDAYLSIKIIHILSDANMKSSVPHLKNILKDKKQNYLVKSEAKEAINKIT